MFSKRGGGGGGGMAIGHSITNFLETSLLPVCMCAKFDNSQMFTFGVVDFSIFAPFTFHIK